MPNSRLFSLAATLACMLLDCAKAEPTPAYPSYSIPNTVRRTLPKTVPDRVYELYIGLPASFALHPERKYPVIVVTDGYWAFAGVNSTVGSLAYGKHIPESLVVGLSYKGENLDYNAMRVADLVPYSTQGTMVISGHADRFLEVIETEVLPLMENEYRANPNQRYLVGSSNGGLFGVYTMFSKPNLFQGYVLDSPAILAMWGMERDFATSGQSVAGRVYITSSENEWTGYRRWIVPFYERMKQHGYVKGGLQYHETQGVRHSAGTAESFMRGLMYVMEPLAPERGVATDLFQPTPGMQTFAVTFKTLTANLRPDVLASAMREHVAYETKLIAERRTVMTIEDSSIAPDSGGVLFIDCPSRIDIANVIANDPAVKAGVLEAEVLGDR